MTSKNEIRLAELSVKNEIQMAELTLKNETKIVSAHRTPDRLYKFAKNAVLLHDSVFLHSKIDLSKMVNFQPLWTFDPYKYDFVDHYNDLIFIFNKLST